LIVPGDPDNLATQEFEKVFGSCEFALLLADVDDPYAPAVLARVDAIERALAKIPPVTPSSALSVFRRTQTRFDAAAEDAAAFRRFATGTDLLRHQGLVGDGRASLDCCRDAAHDDHSEAQGRAWFGVSVPGRAV